MPFDTSSRSPEVETIERNEREEMIGHYHSALEILAINKLLGEREVQRVKKRIERMRNVVSKQVVQ